MERIDTMISDNPWYNKLFAYLNKITDTHNCYSPECSYKIVEKDNNIPIDFKKSIL